MQAELQPQLFVKAPDRNRTAADRQSMMRAQFHRRLTVWDAIGLLLIVIAATSGAYHCGMRGVEQWDMSIFADGAYRIYHGQIPYRDFHLPFGPVLFYLLAAICRLLGGFTWSHLILANALIGAAATVIGFLSLRLFLTTVPSLLFAAVLATTFAMPLSFPWHDVVAMFWAAGALASCTLALWSKGSGVLTWTAMSIAGGFTTLSILTKQNIGGALFLTLFALLLFLPFAEKEGLRARLLRVLIYGGSCLLLGSGIALVLQHHGSFFADITVANNQLSRLAKLWDGFLLIDDLRFWWQSWRLEIKLLVLLAAGVPVFCYLRRLSLRRMQLIALAAAGLLVTYFMRKTGVGAYQMYVVIVPLALGFLYAACAPTGQSLRIASRKLLTLWYATIILSVGTVLAAFGQRSAIDASHYLIAGRYSPSWLALMIIAATVPAWMILTLAAIRRTREVIITPMCANRALTAARLVIVLVAIGTGLSSLHVSATRATWHPDYVANLVPFQHVPAMAGVEATPWVVEPVEDLLRWFEPRLRESPELTRGTEIFVYPSFQMLYMLLDVQSFRGVALWYDWKVSYSRLDCDTDVIVKAQPRFVITHAVELTPYGKPQAEMLATAPRLQRHIDTYYQVAHQNAVFTVFERRGLEPATLALRVSEP